MIASRLSRASRAVSARTSKARSFARRGLATSSRISRPSSLLFAAAAAAAAATVTTATIAATPSPSPFGLKVVQAAPAATAAQSVAFKQAIKQADLSFDRRGEDGNLALAHTLLTGVYEEAVRNGDTAAKAELCWRLARACYNLRTSKDPKDVEMFDLTNSAKKKELAELCEKYAMEAVEVDPGHYRGHYWVGIAIQAVGEHQGTKASIERLVSVVSP